MAFLKSFYRRVCQALKFYKEPPPRVPEVKIVMPTPEEVASGRARLESYLPHWKSTPGLIIIKPIVAAVVAVREYATDDLGFTLRLHTEENLEGSRPADFNISCVWNQPYMSFSKDQIHAAYSFTLYFGADGVARARELHALLPTEGGRGPHLYRCCFGENAERSFARFRDSLRKPG